MTDTIEAREFSFPSSPENVLMVDSFIEQVKQELPIPDAIAGNILVALTEAASNCIYHGNHSDPNKMVKMSVEPQGDKMIFTVEDQGAGFDFDHVADPTAPENIDKPTGRGIFLMRNLADEVNYQNGGNKVSLVFRLV